MKPHRFLQDLRPLWYEAYQNQFRGHYLIDHFGWACHSMIKSTHHQRRELAFTAPAVDASFSEFVILADWFATAPAETSQ